MYKIRSVIIIWLKRHVFRICLQIYIEIIFKIVNADLNLKTTFLVGSQGTEYKKTHQRKYTVKTDDFFARVQT